MNKVQLIILWVGIAVFVLIGLLSYYSNNISIDTICLKWAMVAVVTGSLIYTLRVRPQIVSTILKLVKRFRKAIIVLVSCLLVLCCLIAIESRYKEQQIEKQRKKDIAAHRIKDSMKQILHDGAKWLELNEAEKIVHEDRWVQLPSRLFSNRPPDETYSYIGGLWLNKQRVLEMKEKTIQDMKKKSGQYYDVC